MLSMTTSLKAVEREPRVKASTAPGTSFTTVHREKPAPAPKNPRGEVALALVPRERHRVADEPQSGLTNQGTLDMVKMMDASAGERPAHPSRSSPWRA